jgi:DNA-binding CsgD family transcriptional regulator
MITAGNLGHVALRLGDLQQARAALLESLGLAHEIHSPYITTIAQALVGLSSVILAEVHDPYEALYRDLRGIGQAARLLGLAAGMLESRGWTLQPFDQPEFDKNVAIARDRLGEEAFTAAWEEGRAMSLEQALELASQEYRHEVEAAKSRGRGRPRMRAPGGLTYREYEVARLVTQDLSNEEIAGKLVVSVRTVEMHVSNALHKLGLTTRAQLAAWAVEQGLAPAT